MNGAWSMAMRNLSRNKRRNAATGVAIGLGFAALLALGGYINRAENYLRVYTLYAMRTGHLTIYKKDGLERFSVKPKTFSLTAEEQDKIRARLAALDNVEMHGPQLTGAGLIGNGCRTVPFIATGIDPKLDDRLRHHPSMRVWADDKITNLTKGRSLAEFAPEDGAVALTVGLARLLRKGKVHDEFPRDHKPVIVTDCLAPEAKDLLGADANVQLAAGSWSGMMSALDGEVVALFETGMTETANAALLTSLEHLQKLYDTANAGFYSVWLKNPAHLAADASTLQAQLASDGLAVDIYPWHDERIAPMYSGTMQFLYTMVTFISVVLATVIIFSVFNAATMTVIERIQEIGMMRSLGFTRGEIRRLFVREMLALAIISVTLGGLVAATGIWSVNHAGVLLRPPGVSGGMMLKLVPNVWIVAGATVLIFSLAVLTTLTAVRNVANRNIAVLLMGTHR